jgi:hypothetical protein
MKYSSNYCHNSRVKIVRPAYKKEFEIEPPPLMAYTEYLRLSYPEEWNDTLKRTIRRRDGYQCQNCKTKRLQLCVHHINYDKRDCSESNLITLCTDCHDKTNKERDYWYKYLYNVMAKRTLSPVSPSP